MRIMPKGLNKRPILICLGYGEIGRWWGNEPSIKDGCLDVLYYPQGGLFRAMGQPLRLRNVPETIADSPVIFSPKDVKGADSSGYKFLLAGDNGVTWLKDKLQLFMEQSITQIHEDMRVADISAKQADVALKRKSAGEEETLKDLKRTQDILTSVKRDDRDKRRRFGEEGREE